MASIARDKNGNRRILFVAPDGRRPTIRLGKASLRIVEDIKTKVQQLADALRYNQPVEGKLAEWVAGLERPLAKKLARVGLIPNAEPKAPTTLAAFLKSYIDGRSDLKPATKIVRGHVVRDLNEFFGESRDVRTITPGDADDFKQSLVNRELASTTIHKRLQVARSFFHAMRRRKLIHENPFDGVKAAASGVKDRQRFVSRDEIKLVLAACPDHNWECIVALSRYGGLRCPSEVLSLRIQDIDWAGNRVIVTSPKTEHHAGKASRTIPLFPELKPYLEKAFDLAPPGAVYIIDEKYRKAANGAGGWMNANLRTTFEKIVKRAGLTPWPRPFHNLRASRETELAEKYPVQVVTDWLGNTPKIAMRHYLMTTDEHFEAAIKGDEPAVEAANKEVGEEASKKAAQKAAQRAHAGHRGDSHEPSSAHKKPRQMPGCASSSETPLKLGMAGTGFEPATSRL